MVPLNDFIDSNKNSLRNFLVEIINKPTEESDLKIHEATNSLTARLSTTNLVTKKEEEKKGKEQVPKTTEQLLEPLEVPRYAVESSLCFLYNQFYRTKDRVFSSLERYCTPDEIKIIVNKCNAIMSEIGEPIQRDINSTNTIRK